MIGEAEIIVRRKIDALRLAQRSQQVPVSKLPQTRDNPTLEVFMHGIRLRSPAPARSPGAAARAVRRGADRPLPRDWEWSAVDRPGTRNSRRRENTSPALPQTETAGPRSDGRTSVASTRA